MVLPYIEMNPPQAYMCSPSWTLLPPASPYHPSGSSQHTSPKHPVSCIEIGLVTRFIYDIIHISMPFSQIIPPSPSPTESKRLGREEGGGFRMGNTCIPVADSFWYMAKPIQYCKVKLKKKKKVKVTQSCLTLCNPMDYTVHLILQARILEKVAFPSSRGSS